MYRLGRGVGRDPARAAGYYTRSCDAGYADSCADLGFMYLRGDGMASDDHRAFALFQEACDGGSALGCSNLGYMHENGRGVAPDIGRADTLYQQACDNGVAGACFNLADAYLHGRGIAHDEARAVSLYKRACDSGDPQACDGLGAAYEYARGVNADEPRAAALYRQACDAGFARGCDNLKRLTAENPELARARPQGSTEAQTQASGNNSSSAGLSRGVEPTVPAGGAPNLTAFLESRYDYALLVATDDYNSWQALQNPVTDARAIAKELKEGYGFSTELLENPTQKQILDALRHYSQMSFGPGDQLFVFFAGHGIFDEQFKQGFVVARDSDMKDLDRTSYISFELLRAMVDGIPAKHIFLVMDACFGGTFDRRIAERDTRGGEPAGLPLLTLVARKSELTTRKYLTSGGKNYVPDGGRGAHSPFAGRFLEVLRSYGGRKHYLGIDDFLVEVRDVNPSPVWGSWGKDEPGSDFLFISKLAVSPEASSPH